MGQLSDINKAVSLLREGQLVAIPTETVYGLAANAFSDKAVAKIYETKNRPANNPLIVHIHSMEQLDQIAVNIPEQARLLAGHFWPGPLTLVLEKSPKVSEQVTAGKPTVAVRMPDHEVTLALLRKLDFPLVAPSANRSNHISPTRPEHVRNSLGDRTPFILEGGQCTKGIESTIVGFENDMPVIYRLGTISESDIEQVLGRPVTIASSHTTSVVTPGMFKKHYSPKTPFLATSDIEMEINRHSGKTIGVIFFREPEASAREYPYRVLSATGDYKEAAAKLYSTMHELDQLHLDLILAELLPDDGVGASVNDRMTRASSV